MKSKSDMPVPVIDGVGALYFVAPRPQATPMTRDEMRDMIGLGRVEMNPAMGKTFGVVYVASRALVALAVMFTADWYLV